MNAQKRNGRWEAEALFEFEGAKKLSIKTYKSAFGRGLVSNASVNEYGDGIVTHAFGMGSSTGDYSEQIIVAPNARGTEKAVNAQQAEALKAVPAVMERARAHYAQAKLYTLRQSAAARALGELGRIGGAAA